MSIKAKISRSYRWRIGIVGLAAVAFGCWFIYDWQVGYPGQRELWLEYESVVRDDDGELVDNFEKAWADHAEANGLSADKPKEISETDIQTQLYYGIPCFLVGLPFLFSALLMGRRYVESDEDAVWDHKGTRAAWDEVREIDKSRWATKGIAVIHTADGKRIVLDDWKFDRKPTQQIMARVESKVASDVPGAGSAEPAESAEEEDAAQPDTEAPDERAQGSDAGEAGADETLTEK